MKRALYPLLLAQIGFMTAVALFALYLFLIHDNPAIIVHLAETDKQAYAPGDVIRMRVAADIRSQAPSVTRLEIVTDTASPVTVAESLIRSGSIPQGYIDVSVPAPTIPLATRTGRYYIHAITTYRPNPIAVRETEWRSNSFDIVEPKPPEPIIRIETIEVDRPVIVTEYVYVDRLPEIIPVAAIAPIAEPKLNGAVSNSISPDESAPIDVAPSPPASPPEAPIIIVIITPEPTKHELHEQRKEEHRAAIEAKQEEKQENKGGKK